MNQRRPEPRIALSTWGRFHFFHLARQLDRHQALDRILSTYPRFKLRGEGIEAHRLLTCGSIELLLRGKGRFGLDWPALDERLEAAKVARFDRFIASHLGTPDVYIALSGSGAVNGPRVQRGGARYICDRGSTHILHADAILAEEFARYGLTYRPTYQPFVERELAEYEAADVVTVPSNFVAETFVRYGVDREKIFVNPYGASLDRFRRSADPDPRWFTLIFVGAARVRKGFGYLLEAFRRLKHPRKRLWVVGATLPETRTLAERHGVDHVEFLGRVPNDRLSQFYSRADAMVLPSIEEGLALVQAEALACGCPVLTTPNSGAEDLFSDGVEGFIVPARDPAMLAARLQQWADTPDLARAMGNAGQVRIRQIGGWDSYGDRYMARCRSLVGGVA